MKKELTKEEIQEELKKITLEIYLSLSSSKDRREFLQQWAL